MDELVLATYMFELKNAFQETISDPDLLELLYDGVADPLGLLNQNKQTISVSPAQASLIVNRRKYGNALKVIRNGASKDEVRASIEGYFKKHIVPRLHKEKTADLLEHLRRIIELDREIAESRRTELLSIADEKTLAKFLGYIYLYVVSRDNVLKEIRLKTAEEIEEYKKHPLRRLAVPAEVIEEEKKYTDAILAIYAQLEKKIAEGQDIDIEGKLAEIITRAEDVEKRIAKATSESRSLMKQIYEVSSKLEEARFLRERYEALESQYTSDLKRLRFIQDGEQKGGDIHKAVKCPFCDHDMSDVPDTKESFIETSSIEMAKVEYQLEDLAKVKDSNENKIQQLESMIEELNAQNEKMVEMIQKDLKPYAAQLRDQIATYQSVLDTRQELYAIDSMTAELNTDAWEKENDEDSDNPKFSGRQCISQKTWKELSDAFNQMVKDCGYPNRPESRINIDTVDAVVGSKFKKDEGKGYRAFLNTIMLFNLMKYLESNALFAPHILVLDSPILSLKEKKYKISEKEKATPGMRTSLFQYLIDHCGENQIIIAENEIPDDVDYKNAKLQEFTLEPGNGRYGFLKIRNRVVTAKHSRNGRE